MATVTAWDRSTAARTFALALSAFVVALLVTAASDEGGVSWPARLARTLPAAPLLSAAATALVAQRARARGEWRALASVGAAPFVIARGTVTGALFFALVAAVATALLPGAAAAFFPRAPFGAHFVPRFTAETRAFLDPASGWSVLPDGALVREAARLPATGPSSSLTYPAGASVSAALTLAAAGLGLSLLVAAALSRAETQPRYRTRSLASRLGRPVALAALVLFAFQHAAATGHGAVIPVALSFLFVVDGAREFFRLDAGAT